MDNKPKVRLNEDKEIVKQIKEGLKIEIEKAKTVGGTK